MRAQSRSVNAGQNIYAYCNVRTNQVLYSLTCQLRNRPALKQLPDAGANNNPPKLRKDLWRPLWTLTLPSTANGQQQRLNAFDQLRKYRTLHEYNWKPFEFFSRRYTEEEIEEMKKKLNQRGGSKKESVFDVIKHQQRKLRARHVMDQKANSIADLAAVLINQEREGSYTTAAYRALAKTRTPSIVQSGARDEDTQISQSSPSEKNLKLSVSGASENANSTESSDAKEIRQLALPTEGQQSIRTIIMKLRKGDQLPIFTARGVRVSWDNILDAEFAQAWPRDVEHVRMGLFRNTAPEPGRPRVTHVGSSKSRRRKMSLPLINAKDMHVKNGIRPAVVNVLKTRLIESSPISRIAPRMLKRLGANRSETEKRLVAVLKRSKPTKRRRSSNKA